MVHYMDTMSINMVHTVPASYYTPAMLFIYTVKSCKSMDTQLESL